MEPRHHGRVPELFACEVSVCRLTVSMSWSRVASVATASASYPGSASVGRVRDAAPNSREQELQRRYEFGWLRPLSRTGMACCRPPLVQIQPNIR